MRRLSKRGMDDKLSFFMWEAAVILMVVIALAVSVRGIANNTNYWKKYHSADLALMTDLMMTNQGDFVINYDFKDLEKNFVTKLLYIDKLTFQTVLKQNSYFVYDESMDKDRFPQSYVFAENNLIHVNPANSSSDYVVLYKTGNTFDMKTGYSTPRMSCPSTDTRGNLSAKKFDVISISDSLNEKSKYVNTVLKTYNGNDAELLIVLASNNYTNNNNANKDVTTSSSQNIIYYDPLSIGKSSKMSCLIARQMIEQNPTINIKQLPYNPNDKSLDVEPFKSQKANHIYWVLIQINNNETTNKELSDSIKNAIEEYYN